jgi:molybdate transport system ATP-binding protein
MNSPSLRIWLRVPLDKFTLDVDFTSKKRVIGLFGPSGSGKTTLLESVAGFRRKARGYMSCGDCVWQDSERGIRLPTEKRGVGYVPQDHLLFPHFNVRSNLEFGANRSRRDGQDFDSVFEEVVAVLELEPLLSRKITAISGGEKQRVALGRALCSGPRLLMLDEPLSSLDIQLRYRILPFLIRVRDHFRIPMLIVSHNPFEQQALCDEVIALREGKVIAQGNPTEVFTRNDVYTLAAAEGYQNILSAVVTGHYEHKKTLRLGDDGSGQEITMLKCNQAADTRVMIGFPANEILVATRRLEGVSARNQLTATIRRIQSIGHKKVITADVSEKATMPVVIELTQDAVEELHLDIGTKVSLIIKSSSIMIYG